MNSSIVRRVRQVWAACRAAVTPADEQFVARSLTAEQQQLFYAMDLPHQYHSLRVAYTALAIKEREGLRCDERLLVSCALLHDTAKQAGTMSTMQKIICVLLDKIMPRQARRLARAERGSKLRYAVYLYYNHAHLAAQRLGGELGAIIARHHDNYIAGEPIELTILRRADDLN